MRTSWRYLGATVTAASVLLVSGCSSTADESAPETASESSAYPMTIENCGHPVTLDAPPQRAVSLNQGSTEILLSLGLANRMVGTATWTDPVRENLAADNARVPRLADNKPSFEVVLDTEPDFVTASFGGTLGPGGVADRDQFDQLGVPSYLSPTDCDGKTDESVNADGARTELLRIDTVYKEIRELAAIFDVRDRGEAFVAELQQRFEAASGTVNAAGVSLAYWFADTKTPYMAGCCGSSGIITNSVGAQNIFSDTTDEWPQVSWESVLDRDPTALVLADLSRRSIDGDALDSKIAFLESNPVTQRLTAVRDQRYIVVNGADLNPSIRTVDGVEKTAAALKQWGPAR
ncbi:MULTISPECIES: ABC transporter substrate-binding protein [unclassified Rhodococcus (in: high G+C Gram-positive bacteria)]|uniref:ABC transporter substrate-binding protein n=1 Tax=unclassified Rhodococcus (in: high G+C Gram-positive bacteria) TaxID=192944 RepID=UPI00163B0D62|nr:MULTISPECIES: ABC transporter substrate-binding protein [unclassified Rhodococcus (in: high G+C Gram-positive bacteria)]MBC2644370.1 ABC transporter substrate-binding protein [Rhodococcus sp. 3A]MBC2897938.1 ABC transporter substrate-binding protein [Rhodococcus sp. 4CII]